MLLTFRTVSVPEILCSLDFHDLAPSWIICLSLILSLLSSLLTFTAEFSLSSLIFYRRCLAHFSLYNFSLGSHDSKRSAVVLVVCFVCLGFFPICCCVLPEGIWEGWVAQAQRCSRPIPVASG